MALKEGDLVTYIPYDECDKSEELKGKVKSINESNTTHVFVVFHCNNEWDKYKDYTGQSTKINQLRLGWDE